ncbi:MAG: Integrase-like, catalytic core [Nitrosopumilales archaeon]|nr:MAG: Integrase-like, catalytic core [Nitrosopumilales archaeon]
MTVKLDKKDVVQITEDSLTLFKAGIKSEKTMETYEKRLKEFVCATLENYLDGDKVLREKQRQQRLAEGDKKKITLILDADFSVRSNELVKKAKENPDEIVGMLLSYSTKLKERCEKPKQDPDYLNPNTVPNMFKPIKKLFKMNGVHFEWQRVDATYPEAETNPDSRGYTREEIGTILKFTNPFESAVTLIASSSGMRRTGFEFTWDCIKPVYRRNSNLVMGNYDDNDDSDILCGMIIVYAGSNEQYFALFTPEAWEAIKTYKIQWHSDVLKNPKPKDPFLKRAGNSVITLSCDAMANRLNKILKKAKIREPLEAGKRNYDVPIMNGFRRFFNKINKETFSKDSPLAALIKKEMMLSHTGLVQLDKNYFKIHWKELVEEYLEAVSALTISSEERAKAQLRIVRKKNSGLENEKWKVTKLEHDVKKMRHDMSVILGEIQKRATKKH